MGCSQRIWCPRNKVYTGHLQNVNQTLHGPFLSPLWQRQHHYSSLYAEHVCTFHLEIEVGELLEHLESNEEEIGADLKSLNIYTVEPPIANPPNSGFIPYSERCLWHETSLPLTLYINSPPVADNLRIPDSDRSKPSATAIHCTLFTSV